MLIYEKLDELIIESLTRHNKVLMNLYGGEVRAECRRLGEALGRDDFRVMDGRLSALKKAGKIKYVSRIGWMLA